MNRLQTLFFAFIIKSCIVKSYVSMSVCGILFLVYSTSLSAAPLNLPHSPLFIESSKTALVQLVVQRDNKLFYEAYNSYDDLDGDGDLDIYYEPDNIDYYGYFDSNLCYTYLDSVSNPYFQPIQNTSDKKCESASAPWSGDFLNYLTMTRMDTMLRALYGGKRFVDTDNQTILRRAFVPWSNHTWGIEYQSTTNDGYDIADYTPLSQPDSDTRHLFATNNWVDQDDTPYLRIRENNNERIWHWVDKERTQGDGTADYDYILDVEVCRTTGAGTGIGLVESHCQQYPNGNYKPTGILHEYGENNSMYFSLLTGSYENNIQGGVLRQTMGSFGDKEIDSTTGQFLNNGGIVNTLDAFKIPYLPGYYDQSTIMNDCGWLATRDFNNGECKAWGNPIAEMMYEGMRYLAGEETPTPSFETSTGMDELLGLESKTWNNPFDGSQPYSQCSSAYQLVISDPNPTFDGDQLPGSYFSTFTDSTLGALNVGNLADTISSHEPDIIGQKFIGESNGIADNSPSPKAVTTLKTVRGLAPEAPHRKGSYYAPSISYFGHQNDLHPDLAGNQNVKNFTLALASPVPTIDVEINGKTISLVPYAKTVGSRNNNANTRLQAANYYPTNALVNFTVEEVSERYGSYRVSFEDMAQGADNDQDALIRLEYEIDGSELVVTVTSFEASGHYIQHLGYTVSGTSNDGLYLVVRDQDTPENKDVDYELDVPEGEPVGGTWDDDTHLPLVSERRFTPSNTPAAEVLQSPLWYAAKWGGFDDTAVLQDGIPQSEEWDSNGDGDPDNYFQVREPSKLEQSLRSAFSAISDENADANAVGVSGGSLTNSSYIYESSFRSRQWYGNLTSRAIDKEGNLATNIEWDANVRLQNQIDNDERQILTYKLSSGKGIPFRWPVAPDSPTQNELDKTQTDLLSLDPITDLDDGKGEQRVSYLRGNEVNGFRERAKPLGDIVHSTPQLVGPPVYYYPDNWGTGEPESDQPYSEYGATHANRDRVVYVGANDGMLHAFDSGEYSPADGWNAGTGDELFAYVPSKTYKELPELTSSEYSHRFYVDATPRIGDAFIDNSWRTILISGMGRGGQGVFALDVTDPSTFNEADADDVVLWEFTDEDNPDLGYTYESPLIARMHNGKWMAIFGSGYNNTEADGHVSSSGKGAIFFVDLETGQQTQSVLTAAGSPAIPNAIRTPNAVDLDGDNIIDIIYAADILGNLQKIDVRSSNPANWGLIGNRIITAQDDNGNALPVTSAVAVGSHPTGEGVLIYMGTGKYLEPSDLNETITPHRIIAVWDEEPFLDNDLQNYFSTNFLEQSITSEASVEFDTDGDGTSDTYATTRTSTKHTIDWETHKGWYMDLTYPSNMGEQVINQPLLREGRLIISTQIPAGDECSPELDGWLMLLDAASGAMNNASIDLNGDGIFNSNDVISGVKNINNPLAPPIITAAGKKDLILTDSMDGSKTNTTSLNTSDHAGRVSWRELEP